MSKKIYSRSKRSVRQTETDFVSVLYVLWAWLLYHVQSFSLFVNGCPYREAKYTTQQTVPLSQYWLRIWPDVGLGTGGIGFLRRCWCAGCWRCSSRWGRKSASLGTHAQRTSCGPSRHFSLFILNYSDFEIYLCAKIVHVDYLSCVKYSMLLISDVIVVVVGPLFIFNIKT